MKPSKSRLWLGVTVGSIAAVAALAWFSGEDCSSNSATQSRQVYYPATRTASGGHISSNSPPPSAAYSPLPSAAPNGSQGQPPREQMPLIECR